MSNNVNLSIERRGGTTRDSRWIRNKRARVDLPLLHMLVHSHPERSEQTLLLYLHTETFSHWSIFVRSGELEGWKDGAECPQVAVVAMYSSHARSSIRRTVCLEVW